MTKSKRLSVCIYLCMYALLFFFTRTIFPLYKYFFFLSLVPAVIAMFFLLVCYKAKLNLKLLWLPLLVFALYLVHYASVVNVQKEIVNTTFIFVIVAFTWRYLFQKFWQQKFLKAFVVLVEIVGFVAIARFAVMHENMQIPFSKYLFAPNATSFSIADDYNFFALYQLVAIVVASYLYTAKQLGNVHFTVISLVASASLIASGSRRGYFLYFLLCTVAIFLLFCSKNRRLRVSIGIHLVGVTSFVVVFVSMFLFVASIRDRILLDMAYNRLKVYRIKSYLPENAYGNFVHNMWSLWSEDKNVGDKTNLYYNGDLSNGLRYWYCTDQNGRIQLKEENGQKFMRIEKIQGEGHYQISYKGRPIYYHKGVEYVIRFKYRVVEGMSESPFYVGWWIDDGGNYIHNLTKNVQQIDDSWNLCEVRHVFVESQNNPPNFLNTLAKGSCIDVKDISLTCNDTAGLPMFADQIVDIHDMEKVAFDTTMAFNSDLTYTRLDRWRYAWEIWQTRYSTKQKIFGHGFNYLEWYGEKFYGNPKRYDFPHNPIISSFLYSGIIGGAVYILFLIMSLWLYWMKRRTLGIFFIMYLCCMFFCMFSGSSHFSFPLFAFLSFLPFVELKNIKSKAKIY